jgi:SsrA-binding protein
VSYYKLIAENRQAFFDYHILETYQAGLELLGSEVKSLRLGRVNLKDSFARVEKGQVFLYNMHISPYEKTRPGLNPLRVRKLLLNSGELRKLYGRVAEKGLTLIPLKLYFEGDWAKIDLAVGKAKKKFEKRAKLRKEAVEKEVEKEFKEKLLK